LPLKLEIVPMESTHKIYINNRIENVSYDQYRIWLKENGALYFVGPHITKDKREIYTAFTANSSCGACFTTFEVFLNEEGVGEEDNIYESADWATARQLHKSLLKAKVIGSINISNRINYKLAI
jgi:hypothetical protein